MTPWRNRGPFTTQTKATDGPQTAGGPDHNSLSLWNHVLHIFTHFLLRCVTCLFFLTFCALAEPHVQQVNYSMSCRKIHHSHTRSFWPLKTEDNISHRWFDCSPTRVMGFFGMTAAASDAFREAWSAGAGLASLYSGWPAMCESVLLVMQVSVPQNAKVLD